MVNMTLHVAKPAGTARDCPLFARIDDEFPQIVLHAGATVEYAGHHAGGYISVIHNGEKFITWPNYFKELR